jgi:predicted methyltransferase
LKAFVEGISEVIYTNHEVKELRKLSTEDLKTIHKVRKIFPDSTIEEIKRGKIK